MTWHQVPFLRILFPFLLGILLESYWSWSNYHIDKLYAILIIVFGVLGLFLLKKKPAWSQINFWGMSKQFLLLVLGLILTHAADLKNNQKHYSLSQKNEFEKEEKMQLILQVEEPIQVKTNSVRALCKVIAKRQDSSEIWLERTGYLLATLALDTNSTNLKYGDRLLSASTIQNIQGAMNPYALDLRTYYAIKQVYHQTYIPAKHWQKIEAGQGTWLWDNIYNLRAYLVTVFRKHAPTDREYAVLAGLILGVREDMDKEIIQAYADVGAMHILSVSGLHVGLIAWMLLFLFDRIHINHFYWRLVKTILVIALIWLFALLTGATPPALRSAAMFSFVTVAKLNRRHASIYNSLAASAFFLLLYNPLWLWDAGFQLSYLALLGIVYYQDKFYRMWYIDNKFLRWVWNMTTVSIAASISTFALGLFYFHQFSFSSFLSGLVAIPLSSALLPLGFMLLIVNEIPYLSDLLGLICYYLVWLLNASVFVFQALPYAVIKQVWIDRLALHLLHIMVLAITYAFIVKKTKWLLIGKSALAAFVLYISWQEMNTFFQREFCIYSINKGSAISIIEGKNAITFADSATLNSNALQFAQNNHLRALSIENEVKTPLFEGIVEGNNMAYYSKEDIIQIKDFACAVYSPKNMNKQNTELPFPINAVLITNNVSNYKAGKNLLSLYKFDELILDASNSAYTIRSWEKWADSLEIPVYNIKEKGAYRRQFN